VRLFVSAVLSRSVAFCNKWTANFLPLNFPLKRPPTVLMLPKQQGIQKAKGYSSGGHSTGLQCTVHSCPHILKIMSLSIRQQQRLFAKRFFGGKHCMILPIRAELQRFKHQMRSAFKSLVRC